MSPFATTIKHCVTDYKRALKRHHDARTYSLRVKKLCITPKTLKNASDVDLYQIANRLLCDVESSLANQETNPTEYSGLEEFRQHLKASLRGYYLENNKVLNSHQQASRLMVESIQLLGMPLNEISRQRLTQNIEYLKHLGNSDALIHLNTALRQKNAEMNNQLQSILQLISPSNIQ